MRFKEGISARDRKAQRASISVRDGRTVLGFSEHCRGRGYYKHDTPGKKTERSLRRSE